MDYTVKKLSLLSGVSARTLRYYDQIGLLTPARISANDYRVYGAREVDTLQTILFYRELGIGLDDVKRLLTAPDFDRERVLRQHLAALIEKRAQVDLLIANVGKTIASMKGKAVMQDKEKFEGFKQKALAENEAKYGAEIREKYGEAAVEASNAKFSNMTQAQCDEAQRLSQAINDNLKEACAQGDPHSALAQETCALHRQWLCLYWPDGTYSKEAHAGLSQMYCDDERFKAYYEAIAPGCAAFLRDAIHIYCGVEKQ